MVRLIAPVLAVALLAQAAFAVPVPGQSSWSGKSSDKSSDSMNSYGSSGKDKSSYGSSGSSDKGSYGSSGKDSYGSSGDDKSGSSYGGSYDGSYGGDKGSKDATTIIIHETTTAAMAHETTTAMKEETTAMKEETTSSVMMEETTSSVMMEETTTMMEEATSTTMMAEATSTAVSYGSGSSSWGSGYDSCVQKCQAAYGGPQADYTAPPAASATEDAGAGGNGVTKTVLVAPTLGVLRFVPAFMNATVGETIKFIWTQPANHTVSKSSSLDLCNKTADNFFTSGVRNGSFEFTQVVNDTNPTFFYCSVGKHCANGMFGIINPTAAFAGDQSVGVQAPNMAAAVPELASAMSAVNAATKGSGYENWGSTVLLDQVPEQNRRALVENILFSRAFLAANPDAMAAFEGTGSFDMSSVKIPTEVNNLLTGTSSSPAGAPGISVSNAPTGSATGALPSGTLSANVYGSSGSKLGSSSLVVAIVAVLATFFAL